LGDSFLISTLAGFQQQHPGIRVDVELQNRRVDLIQEGFDLALRAGRLEDTSLVGKKVSDSTLSIYASEAYLERKGTPSKFADLAEHDCLCLNGLGSTWTMEGPNGAESVRITGPLIANEIGFLTRAVVEGMGLALLPTRRALMHLQAKIGPKLVPVLPDYKIHGGALWLLWPSSRHIPLRIALLRDHLFAAFQRLNDDCDELERTARAECQLEHRNQALNTRKRRVQAGRG
jgi:DNA-binding transcriptional LysR family regulator